MFVLGCFVCFCAIFLWSRDLGSVSSQLFPFLSSSLFCSLFPDIEIIGSAPITGNNFPFFNRKIHQRGKQAITHQQKRAKEFSNGEPLSSVQDSHTFNTDIFSPLLMKFPWTLMNQWQSQKTFSPLLVDQVKLKGHKRFNQTFEIGFSSVPPQTLADKGLKLKLIW